MLEKDLYKGIIDGARSEGWLLFRIADGTLGKKPFDITGCAKDGKAVAVEVKVDRRTNTNIDNFQGLLEVHQVNWLKAYSMNDAYALVLIYQNEQLVVIQYFNGTPKCELVLQEKNGSWIGWSNLKI
jgi:hypothetical protein